MEQLLTEQERQSEGPPAGHVTSLESHSTHLSVHCHRQAASSMGAGTMLGIAQDAWVESGLLHKPIVTLQFGTQSG